MTPALLLKPTSWLQCEQKALKNVHRIQYFIFTKSEQLEPNLQMAVQLKKLCADGNVVENSIQMVVQ